jgi:hypothetical protein
MIIFIIFCLEEPDKVHDEADDENQQKWSSNQHTNCPSATFTATTGAADLECLK